MSIASYGEVRGRLTPELSGVVISGKYGPGWQPAYDVRRTFVAAGIPVAFPLGDAPLRSYGGYTFSTPDEEYLSFESMQQTCFRRIEAHPYHIVAPGRFDTDRGELRHGYIGFSTAHEVGWAAMHNKPIWLTEAAEVVSRYVPAPLHEAVEKVMDHGLIVDTQAISAGGLKHLLTELPPEVDYGLSDEQCKAVFRGYCNLLRIERHRWLSWAQRTERDYSAGLRADWINERELSMYEEPAAYLPMEDMLRDPDALMYMSGAHK